MGGSVVLLGHPCPLTDAVVLLGHPWVMVGIYSYGGGSVATVCARHARWEPKGAPFHSVEATGVLRKAMLVTFAHGGVRTKVSNAAKLR